jgi:hypothetical protein
MRKAMVRQFEKDETIVIYYTGAGDLDVCSKKGIEQFSSIKDLEIVYPKYAKIIARSLA